MATNSYAYVWLVCRCNCAGEKKDIEARCEQIRQAMETTTSDYDRDKLQERLAKLSGVCGQQERHECGKTLTDHHVLQDSAAATSCCA